MWETETYFDKMRFEKSAIKMGRAICFFRAARESSMKNLCNRYFSFGASFACMQRRFFDYIRHSPVLARPRSHFTRDGRFAIRELADTFPREGTSFTISRALFAYADRSISLPLNKAIALSIKDIFSPFHVTSYRCIAYNISRSRRA